MSGDASPSDGFLPQRRRVDEACDRFEQAWKDGQEPRIEDYLANVPEPTRALLVRELLELDVELRCNGGERPKAEEYHGRFPEYVDLIHLVFANSPREAESGASGSSEGATISHAPPAGSSAVDPEPPSPSGSLPVPEHIGRYKVVRRLGGGTYGDVYLADDADMNRQVAVKVPSAELLATERARDEFLREARNVARLQHKGIVRAYDFGQADGNCYIVYEFVEGESLAERIKPARIAADPLPPHEAARIVAEVAKALHYAHLQGMFHRDIKPANILLDRQGKPKVTDFGLAVHEQDLASQRGILAGTLPYMSPEQVRRESHHIDGRTDIYSLGVVLYELLCGRRPFEAKARNELEDQILHREAKPLRQINDSIPAELERICLKAVSKRINDRYTTAKDIAEELRELTRGAHYPMPLERSSHALSQYKQESNTCAPQKSVAGFGQPVQNVGSLEIVSAHTTSDWELDVSLRNTSDQPAVIHCITITVLEDHGEFLPIIQPSATYDIPVATLEEGESRSIPVSHFVEPHGVDRFKIALHTTKHLVLRLSLDYNKGETVGVLIEAKPLEFS
jgi:serine/threonine protein kinase